MGTSGAIDCTEIKTDDPGDPAALKVCAQHLGPKASLYGTRLAVDDIVAGMNALGIDGVVDALR